MAETSKSKNGYYVIRTTENKKGKRNPYTGILLSLSKDDPRSQRGGISPPKDIYRLYMAGGIFVMESSGFGPPEPKETERVLTTFRYKPGTDKEIDPDATGQRTVGTFTNEYHGIHPVAHYLASERGLELEYTTDRKVADAALDEAVEIDTQTRQGMNGDVSLRHGTSLEVGPSGQVREREVPSVPIRIHKVPDGYLSPWGRPIKEPA